MAYPAPGWPPGLAAELAKLEDLLSEQFRDGGFVKAAAASLVLGGGKRLRPALTIASAHLGQYDRAKTLPLAAAVEVLHTATLAHDDVIDGAATRRGRPTLHEQHGNHVAIYTGDYLLARALALVGASGMPPTDIARIAHALEQLCSGEVAQYTGRNAVPGPREYLKRIMGKTGVLFAAACAIGGRSGGLDDGQSERLWRFGLRLGAAFQIRDDLLDINAGADAAGKPTGRDLLEGVVTLPILLAAADADYRAALDRFLGGVHGAADASELISAARSCGAVARTEEMLAAQLQKCRDALEGFAPGPGREMLAAIIGALSL